MWYDPGTHHLSVGPKSAPENRLHKTDREELAVVHRTASPVESHPSSQGDAAAYWESASARALVQVAVGRCGDVVSAACPGDVAFEACVASIQDGPAGPGRDFLRETHDLDYHIRRGESNIPTFLSLGFYIHGRNAWWLREGGVTR
jgi:hypothetical protein